MSASVQRGEGDSIGAEYDTRHALPTEAGAAAPHGTCFDLMGTAHSSEESMPDRETPSDKNASGNSTPKRGDDPKVPPDPGEGQQTDPDSQKSTASRPRGHTEEPDRTL